MERCYGIKWWDGPLRPGDGPPPHGLEFPMRDAVVVSEKSGLRLEVKTGADLTEIVLHRVAVDGTPLIRVMVRNDEMLAEP